MKLRKNAVKVLAALLPAGVMGMSAALASTPPSDAALPKDVNVAIAKVGETDVAGRLAAIRDAVSTVTDEEAAKNAAEGNVRTAWWANWHGPGFGLGWGNGGWHNWRNGWHNWSNGWHNWGNGWHNWHNWHNW